MPRNRRSFHRQLGQRRYRNLFIVATEGSKTEPQYFALLNNRQSVVSIECLRTIKGSSPDKVLDRMKKRLKEAKLRGSDEAWLVVDKDNWTDEQLNRLHNWSQEQDNYGLAVNNPKFEYWLILHFEEGNGISTSRECSDRLERYLPNYDKGINPNTVTKTRISEAIGRASHRDNPPCADWPRATGTTMYRLVERIISNPI